MTYTYVVAEISEAAFEEIAAILERAGYSQAFHDDLIDMHGIALRKDTGAKTMTSNFELAFASTAQQVYANAKAKGFWDGYSHGGLTIEQVGLKLSLIHSELSEALEAAREGYPDSKKIPEIGNFEEELADAVIRIMDLSHSMGLDVGAAIIKKMAYNVTRPHMHGKKA